MAEDDTGLSIWQKDVFLKVEGADELIEYLSGRYRLALVTNTITSREPDIQRALEIMGWKDKFEAVITSVDVGSDKPHPGIFQVALDRLTLEPSEVVMIGDRVDTDIVGAKRYGIKCILHRWNDRFPIDAAGPEAEPTTKVTSLYEVPKALRQIEEMEP